jgi:hypothetical protein
VATVFSLLCISVISLTNPHPIGGEASLADRNDAAGAAVLTYVNSVGLSFLATATPATVCSSMQSASNATLVLGGQIAGLGCRKPPSGSEGYSSILLNLSDRTVEIEAWLVAQ